MIPKQQTTNPAASRPKAGGVVYKPPQSRPSWQSRKTPTVSQILDLAEIRPGVHILDVACGTGCLFPAYLQRGASSITGVDFSPGMIAQAEKKFRQPAVHLIRADILACRFDRPFDRCMVFNALPYFASPASLLRRLAGYVKPGGRITLAHCQWEAPAHHRACPCSFPLPEPHIPRHE